MLGEVTATRDGMAVDLGGRRQRAALAALVVVRDRAVPAERLADCVWGDQLPANPLGALQAYISHLRRRLEPEAAARRRDSVIARVGNGYLLRLPPDSVDAWRFERAVDAAVGLGPADAVHTLDEALRLWRGPPFAEYQGERWVEAEAVRLQELHAVARERLLDARLRLGDAALVVGELEALVADDPLREERWWLLVLALYRSQRQAAALAALRRARTVLVEELGVEPGPALRSLEAEVLAQSPSLDAPVLPTPRPPARLEAAPLTRDAASRSDEARLTERAAELAALGRMVEDLGGGGSAGVLVEGPAGIGKTALLTETVRLGTAAGLPVLTARCTPMEHAFGFGAVRQLFEPCILERGDTLLSGPAAGARAVFEDQGTEPGATQGGFAALHGLYRMTAQLAADNPLVICVDDVQWCDGASLRYLAYLLRRLEGLPLLVVLTLRTGEQHPDDALLAELAMDPAVVVLRPEPLSEVAVAALVRERLGEGEPAFVGACHRMTSGNPLLLRQLLRALAEEGVPPDAAHVDTVRAVGSRAVSALVELRLRRLPAAVTSAAQAVAVLGDSAGLPTVAALARQPEEDVAAALATLSRSEILAHDHRLRFVHPLVREAVYFDLPAGERELHHERAARILQRHGAPVEQVAAHLLAAPRRGNAATVELLRAAARTALARGASETAVTLFRRAVEEPVAESERPALLAELGLVESHVDGPAAVRHLTEAYAATPDPAEQARLAMAITRMQVFASPPGVATDFAREAAAALPSSGHDDQRQGLLALQRMTAFMHGLPAGALGVSPPEVAGDGDGARMLAATLSYELLRRGVDRDRAVELARFALAGDRLLAADNGLLWVVAADVLLLADADLGDFWDRALVRAQTTGEHFAALSVSLWRGFDQWRRGELGEALRSLADAAEQQRMWGISAATATYAAAFTLGVRVDHGDLEAAARDLAAARELPWVGEGGRLLHEAAARLHLAQGRPAEALAELVTAPDEPTVENPAWSPRRGLRARALAALGRTDEALALAEEEVALLRRWGAGSSLGPGLRLVGRLRGAAGTPELRESMEVLTGTTAVLALARSQLSLARASGVSEREAVTLLHEASATARRCGAESLARAAARELERRGVRAGLKSSSSPARDARGTDREDSHGR